MIASLRLDAIPLVAPDPEQRHVRFAVWEHQWHLMQQYQGISWMGGTPDVPVRRCLQRCSAPQHQASVDDHTDPISRLVLVLALVLEACRAGCPR